MRVNREKYIDSIKKNIRTIRQYIYKLPEDEVAKLFDDLREVFLFYGFKNVDTNFLTKYFASEDIVENEKNLPELESVTNSILFRLKYRHKRTG